MWVKVGNLGVDEALPPCQKLLLLRVCSLERRALLDDVGVR